MNPIRIATIAIAEIDHVVDCDRSPLDYRVAEPLAAPPAAGAPMAVLEPAFERSAYLNLICRDLDADAGPWLSPPTRGAGAIYEGHRAGTPPMPKGALVELVELLR